MLSVLPLKPASLNRAVPLKVARSNQPPRLKVALRNRALSLKVAPANRAMPGCRSVWFDPPREPGTAYPRSAGPGSCTMAGEQAQPSHTRDISA